MASASPTSPQKIGRYEILGELGKGAMGVVYKAQDPNIGRLVALKTMRLDVHGMEANEMLLRFKNEARAAGVLNHSNIVTIYDAGEYEGLFYIAMEYIEGVTLQKRLNEESILPVEQVLDLSRQICSGLDYAHSHKIIHRDVKPANIMIEPDGRVKIMDFGIAKAEGAQLTTAGQVVGTPNYMSPEQVKGRPLDGRTDLWSFGVILYEMVTGEKPFTGQNVTTIIYKIVNENPIAPKDLDSSIHPGLSAVIQRALAKHPDQRYQKGEDLVHHLINYKSIGMETASLPEDAGAAHRAKPATWAPEATQPLSATGVASVVQSKIAPAAAPKPIIAPTPAARPAPAAKIGPTAAAARPSPPPATPASTRSKGGDDTLVAGSHEPAKLASAMANAKAAIPQFSTNQWLVIATGILALVLVVVAVGVYRSEKTKPAAPPAASEATVAEPTTAPAASPGAVATPSPDTTDEVLSVTPVKKEHAVKTHPKAPEKATASAPQPSQTAGASINGTMRLISTPAGAKVEIDGWSEPTWVTPFNSPNLSVGQHKVVISKDGFVSDIRTVQITAGNQAIVAASLRPTVNPSHIEILSDPGGANIFIDGKATGKQTPALIDVPKGDHTVSLRKLGYVDVSVPAHVAEGETVHVSQPLRSGTGGGNPFGKLFGGGIPEGMGALQIKTKPKGASVTINGETAPKTTPFKIVLDPGSYKVVISMDGYSSQSQSITVEKGKTASMDLELKK